jgi:serine/threonine protein kinase
MQRFPPTATDFATVLRQVCQALDFLEGTNVCHLDIKADNIMLRENGHCVLIDFGRAVFTNESKEITKAQWLADDDPPSGAYCLMPMEVLLLLQQYSNREPVTQVLTNKVDVYALGATMYHLWTGAHHDGTFPSDFDAVPKLLAKKKEGNAWARNEGFKSLPKALRTLACMMLHVRAGYRISARVVVKYCDVFLETAQQNVAPG